MMTKSLGRANYNFFVIAMFLLSSIGAYSADFYVNDNDTTGDVYTTAVGSPSGTGAANNPFINLATALAAANSGDTIYIDTGLYSDIFQTITNSDITITGAGSSNSIFDNDFASANSNWFLNIANTATNTAITGIRITGYNVLSAGTGKAITVSGATGVVFTDVETSDNGAGSGDAAMRIEANSGVTINNTSASCNASGGLFGGGIDVDGANSTVTINDSSISSNFKTTKGAGLYIRGIDGSTTVNVNNSIISVNDSSGATGEGTGIYVQDATLNVSNSEISDNTANIASANEYGAGILVGRGATATIDSSLFVGNSSSRGSGLAINTATSNGSGGNSSVTITNSTFDNNEVAGRVSGGRSATINITQTDFINGANVANYNTANITLADSGSPGTTGSITFTNTNSATTAVSSPNVPVLSGDNCSISACPDAGTDAAITICNKDTYDQGLGNPIGTVDLFAVLGGTPDTGGVWTDNDSSGGLNTTTGLLNTWAINQGGIFNYTYTVASTDPSCPGDVSATVTLTLGGFPGVDNPSAVACDTETAVNLFSFLGSSPSATFGGVWTDDNGSGALTGQFFNASAVPPLTPFNFTYTVPAVGTCPERSATVTITVFPEPIPGTPEDLILCETDDLSPYTALDLFTRLTGNDAGGIWTDITVPLTGEITGAADSVINVQNIFTNFGPGTYSFQYTVNPSNPICAPQSAVVDIIIEPVVDLTGSTLSVTPNPICFTDLATTPIIASITAGALPIPDGTYSITYTTGPAPNNGSETVAVTFTGGTGSWTINPAFLNASGTVTIAVTSIVDPSTTNDCERIITNLNTTLEIAPSPDPSDTQVIVDDVCIGEDATATVSDAGNNGGIQLLDGTYTIQYTITPVGTTFSTTVTITGGNGTFTIPSAQIPSEGNYTIDIISWENLAGCTTTSSITDTFVVNPIPDAQNISITIDNVCDGDALVVTITDTSDPIVLVDGTYDILYNIVGPPDLLNQTAAGIVFTAGIGSFTIPSGTLPVGTYTFTITNLTNTSTTCDTTTFNNPSTTFEIFEIPDVGDVVLTVDDICLGEAAVVNISDANLGSAPDLPDGIYDLTYDLSGANVSVGNTTTVTLTGTNGSFTIPAALLTNTGTTTVTVDIITNTTTGCDAVGLPIAASFEINPVPNIDNATISVVQPICEGNDATVTITGAAVSDGNYDLLYDLSGANTALANAVSVVFAGGNTSFTVPAALLANLGVTTITITNITDTNTPTLCSNAVNSLSTSFTISPNPILALTNLEVPEQDICMGQDKVIDILGSTLADGSYTVTYDVSNPVSIGNTASLLIVSGNGTFTIPAALLTNTGNVVVTITNIVNDTTGCSTTLNIATNFNITPLPDATGATVDAFGPYCENDIVQAQLLTALGLPDGDYDITYNLSGANVSTGNIATVSITAGTSSLFTIPAPLNNGTTTLSITVISSVATGCTITGIAITDTFVINPTPQLTATELTVADICLGDDATVTITSTGGLIDGNYTITYDLSGANIAAAQTTAVVIAGSTGSFTIPNALLTNAGATTVSISTILNDDTNCGNTFTDVNATFNVNPNPIIDAGSHLEVPENDICLGTDKDIDVLGTALVDGTYTITFDISSPVSTGNTATLTITGGDGIFTIPAGLLTNLGNVIITITGIADNTTGCTSTGLSEQTNFNVIDVPDALGAQIDIGDICFNTTAAEVNITNAAGMPDGAYVITYDLTGANTALGETENVTFTSGATAFNIPLVLLANAGETTITISAITFNTTQCGTSNLSIPAFTFNVIDPAAPSLNTDGALFCILNNPTIADLTANVSGGNAITWYDAADGGSAYSTSDELVDGTTYYATATDGNSCESTDRLEVTVDLTNCSDVAIVIPDGFSPNDDGANDVYEIPNIDLLYPNYKIEIFNRYGNMVYKGNINTPPFDGKSNQSRLLSNDILPTGVYFIIIYFNDGSTDPIQDRIYLSR
jgi:gliding motility-associated-like protein